MHSEAPGDEALSPGWETRLGGRGRGNSGSLSQSLVNTHGDYDMPKGIHTERAGWNLPALCKENNLAVLNCIYIDSHPIQLGKTVNFSVLPWKKKEENIVSIHTLKT